MYSYASANAIMILVLLLFGFEYMVFWIGIVAKAAMRDERCVFVYILRIQNFIQTFWVILLNRIYYYTIIIIFLCRKPFIKYFLFLSFQVRWLWFSLVFSSVSIWQSFSLHDKKILVLSFICHLCHLRFF